jgi:hypothetical protein
MGCRDWLLSVASIAGSDLIMVQPFLYLVTSLTLLIFYLREARLRVMVIRRRLNMPYFQGHGKTKGWGFPRL